MADPDKPVNQAEALSAFGAKHPVATSPRFQFEVPTAHVPADQVKVIARALKEGSERRPGLRELTLALLGPVGVALLGFVDVCRAVAPNLTKPVQELSGWSIGIGSVAVLAGCALALEAVLRFKKDQRATGIEDEAQRCVEEWVRKLGP